MKRSKYILLILLISGVSIAPAFASGCNIVSLVKDHNNANMTSSAANDKYITCYDSYGGIGPAGITGTLAPDSSNSGVNVSGRVYINSNGYVSTGYAGDNLLYDPRAGKSVYIFACESAIISDLIRDKKYYGREKYDTSGTTATAADFNKPIVCQFKADKPPLPSASAGGYIQQYNDGIGKYLVTFSISGIEGADWITEYNASDWSLAVVKQPEGGIAPDWSTAKVYPGSKTKTISETDLANPYFVAGGNYYVRAQAGNNFGPSGWGNPVPFKIPEGGAGGAASFTYNLEPPQGDKLIVNTITVPSLNLTRPSTATVAKASDLANVINAAAAPDKIVAAIYKWESRDGDPKMGNPRGIVLDSAGKVVAGGDDFPLTAGEGIQVYTTKKFTITLEGK
jgi:hypothetical protein